MNSACIYANRIFGCKKNKSAMSAGAWKRLNEAKRADEDKKHQKNEFFWKKGFTNAKQDGIIYKHSTKRVAGTLKTEH